MSPTSDVTGPKELSQKQESRSTHDVSLLLSGQTGRSDGAMIGEVKGELRRGSTGKMCVCYKDDVPPTAVVSRGV